MTSTNFNREVGTVAVGNAVLTGVHVGPRVVPNIVGAEPFTILAWEEWMQGAHCLDSDPELFYPDKTGRENGRAAKRICQGCPARTDCLRHAIENRETYGIWGGLSPRERRALAKVAS